MDDNRSGFKNKKLKNNLKKNINLYIQSLLSFNGAIKVYKPFMVLQKQFEC